MRTVLVAPPWPAPHAEAAAAAVAVAVAVAHSRARPAPRRQAEATPVGADGPLAAGAGPYAAAGLAPSRVEPLGPRPVPGPPSPAPSTRSIQRVKAAAGLVPLPLGGAPPPPRPGPASTSSRRWSLSAWSFVRGGGASGLAAGGLLGGSQAGARLDYRLNRDPARPLALSVRLSAPLRGVAGAEAALGLDWRPLRRLPVRLLAERRQALGREGRSAFAVTLHGGIGDARAGSFRIDAYAQAGMVGARSRDAFADGSLRLSLPVGGRARLGAGAWAAAQPGLSRVDLGPQAQARLPVGGRSVTLAADWRLRVAGDARPGSGPTLTLATDF